jgi:hypothetical protein
MYVPLVGCKENARVRPGKQRGSRIAEVEELVGFGYGLRDI